MNPAASQGTVLVEVELEGALPKGARPDLTVEGTIEIEKLPDVLYVGRPAGAQPESTVELFRVAPGSDTAQRTTRGARPEQREHHRGEGRAVRGRPGGPLRHVRVGRERDREAPMNDTAVQAVTRDARPAAGQRLLHLEGVTKVFLTDEVETHALSNVHLTVHQGEWVAIVGPSGSGKTTLLAILGLLDTPELGQLPARTASRCRASAPRSGPGCATGRSASSSRASTSSAT